MNGCMKVFEDVDRVVDNERYLLDYFHAHEFIGLEVEVVNAPNPSLIGLEGRVIDETLNTLRIMNEKGIKIIPKKDIVFKFKVGNRESGNINNLIVRGNDILHRPWDRLKILKLR